MEARKMIGTTAVILALALSPILALAQGMGRGGTWGRGMEPAFENRCFSVPDLTEEQRAKLTRLRTDFLNETAPLRGQLATRRTELRALMMDPDVDPAQITAKQREILKLRTQLAEKRIVYQGKWRAVLTREQLRQMRRWRYRRGMGWRHRPRSSGPAPTFPPGGPER